MNSNHIKVLFTVLLACVAIDFITAYAHQDRVQLHGRRLMNTSYPRQAKVRYGGRIVNGVQASIATFPFMVSIQRKQLVWQHYCGGSIFNPTIILTACHCVVNGQKIVGDQWRLAQAISMRVVAGATDWTKSTPGQQIIKVSKLMAHPQCSNSVRRNGEYNNDVGVVVLQTPLFFTNTVQPMKLVSSNAEIAVEKLKQMVLSGERCFSPGWGFTVETTRAVSAQLLVATVQLLTSQQCRERFCLLANNHCQTDFYTINQLCVVSADSSDCYGDSGGPLVCNGLVYGTVSYGHHCYPGWPTVYQNIRLILEMLSIATGTGAPVPSGYAVPPGDEVVIDYGANDTERLTT